MGCALDDVYADVSYSTRRWNSSRMDIVKSDMRCQLQQLKRDTVVIHVGLIYGAWFGSKVPIVSIPYKSSCSWILTNQEAN